MPWLQRDVRVHLLPAVGLAAAPPLGLLLAVGWTPCLWDLWVAELRGWVVGFAVPV